MKFKSSFADYFEEEKAKKVTYRYELVCDSIADKDIVEKLKSVPNKCDYIRRLIREDLRGS